MADPPPLYSTDGLAVETYDARLPEPDQPPIDGDCDFYLGLAREAGGPVLELGAGTGRVTWTLASQGIEVVGLDLSQAMLARAESKRATVPGSARQCASFIQGDMTDFALDRTFGLVICPYRAFQSLLSPEAQQASLSCIHRHLRPQGKLVLHLFDPKLEWLVPNSDAPMMRSDYRHPESGRTFKIEITERRTDPYLQVCRELWNFQEMDDHGSALRHEMASLTLRWTYRWEMRYLLELCGFVIEAEYSDFKGAPPTYGQDQVWVARRP